MILERIVKQTVEAIQFDGSNLKEVYDFICEHRGNANDLTFEELQKNCRPEEIPLDVSSDLEVYSLEKAFDEKWSEEFEAWKDYSEDHPYEKMEDHPEVFPVEAYNDWRKIRLYRQDWRKGELYHIYLTDGGYCRLIGICKGDWFTDNGEPVEHRSDECFKSLYMDRGWKEA